MANSQRPKTHLLPATHRRQFACLACSIAGRIRGAHGIQHGHARCKREPSSRYANCNAICAFSANDSSNASGTCAT